MNNLRYHLANPENSNAANSYGEFSSLDFVINAEGRKLVKNSIKIEGQIHVTKPNGQSIDKTDIVAIDNLIGAHAFFDSFTVTMPESKGLVQSANEYPRYVKNIAAGTMSKNDVFCSDMLAELRGVNPENGRYNLQQINANVVKAAAVDLDPVDPDFSIKPLICMNLMQGDNYSFDKNGLIRLSTNLVRNQKGLFGSSYVSTNLYGYELKNLVVRYLTVPDDGQQGKMLLNSYTMIKNTIASNAANISCRVPSNAVSSVTISFLEQTRENSFNDNQYGLNRFEDFQELNYNFSDSTNQYYSFTITDLSESQEIALEGLRNAGYDQVNNNTFRANNGYLLGLDFNDQFVDLSRNKFSLNLKSSSSASKAYLIYLYFNSLIVV
jgi:hypothetical protein